MRKPDLVINGNYLSRWYIIPRNKYFNIYLHHFTGSDDARALHDHPWWSMSVLFKGELQEVTRQTGVQYTQRRIKKWLPYFRRPTALHRMVCEKSAWTLFITGPRVRQWGFQTRQHGWLHWIDYFNLYGGWK